MHPVAPGLAEMRPRRLGHHVEAGQIFDRKEAEHDIEDVSSTTASAAAISGTVIRIMVPMPATTHP